MHIIKDGGIVEDDWTHLSDEDVLSSGRVTISLTRWLRDREALLGSGHCIGLRVLGSDDPASFSRDLPHFTMVCIEVPAMADGRCFSLARLLRERYAYDGELRVRGDFIRDQIFFLTRVGVNAFECPPDVDLSAQLPAFADFSVKYQAAADEPRPLYKRR